MATKRYAKYMDSESSYLLDRFEGAGWGNVPVVFDRV